MHAYNNAYMDDEEEEEEMRPIIATARHPHSTDGPHQRNSTCQRGETPESQRSTA